MSEPKKPGRPRKDHKFCRPDGFTHDKAFAKLCEMEPGTTLEALQAALKQDGTDVSMHVLKSWSQRHHWRERRDVEHRRKRTLKPNAGIMDVLTAEAREFAPDLVTGLQSRLIAKLAASIDEIEVTTPADVDKLVQVYKELQSIHHAVVGEQFQNRAHTANGNGNGNGNGHAAPENVLSLGQFTKRQ